MSVKIGRSISRNDRGKIEMMIQIDPKLEKPSRDELAKIQGDRLRILVNRAWRHIPFYQRKWKEKGFSPEEIRSVDDIVKIPFTTKKDIAESLAQYPPFGDYQGDFSSIRIQASTGSTGKPKPIFHTRNDWENIGYLWARRLLAQGLRPKEDIIQIAFAYTLFIVGFTSTEGAMKAGALVVPTGSGAITPSERQLQIAHDWGTTVMGCTGSYMLRLGEVAQKMGFDPRKDFKIRFSFHTAEPLTPQMRQEIQEIWGCKAYDNWGSVETGAPTYECEEQNGLHISEDAYIFEIINPKTEEPVSEGEEGELVVTTLFKEAAPFIRYRIGDVTSFIPGQCACGRTYKRINPIRGRVDDMIKIKGVAVYPTDLEPSIAKFGRFGKNYLITVWKEGYKELVKVSVEYMGSDEDREQYCKKLATDLHKVLGLRCQVEALSPEAIKDLLNIEKQIKYKRILDLRK